MSEIERLASVAEATAGESDEGFRAEARKVVRAILTAMREPSDEQVAAFAVEAENWWKARGPNGAMTITDGWRFMIDHILNQDEGLGTP